MQRVIWKGSIRFGLVSCPVSVVTAESHDDLSFTQQAFPKPDTPETYQIRMDLEQA